MAHKSPTLYWLRQDLRLADNPALAEAAANGPVVPVFIWNDATSYPLGGATRVWLHHALQSLAADFKRHGVTLILRKGEPEKIIPALAEEIGAKTVTWCRGYQPGLRRTDARLAELLEQQQIETGIRHGFLLHEPEAITNGSGLPYKVYTPFSKNCLKVTIPAALPAPDKLTGITGVASDQLADWKLIPPKAIWPDQICEDWDIGEAGAHQRLHDFIDEALATYKTGRDIPGRDLTSRLSPYLHFGHISPRQAWHAVNKALHQPHAAGFGPSAERYLLELLWREFSWHLVFHFPDMASKPFNPKFAAFPYSKNDAALTAWQKGQTGYPLVDAGMRQLWQTGWMHNRIRMVTASFVIKHLLIDWREGMAWFWDTLFDADFGNNTASWQWVAGCGADAAPYFRIFNPVIQGEKFDPAGTYIRRYVPELAKLDAKYIHKPWMAPPDVLQQAGITLGKTYPKPIIDHDFARKRALDTLKSMGTDGDQTAGTKGSFQDDVMP